MPISIGIPEGLRNRFIVRSLTELILRNQAGGAPAPAGDPDTGNRDRRGRGRREPSRQERRGQQTRRPGGSPRAPLPESPLPKGIRIGAIGRILGQSLYGIVIDAVVRKSLEDLAKERQKEADREQREEERIERERKRRLEDETGLPEIYVPGDRPAPTPAPTRRPDRPVVPDLPKTPRPETIPSQFPLEIPRPVPVIPRAPKPEIPRPELPRPQRAPRPRRSGRRAPAQRPAFFPSTWPIGWPVPSFRPGTAPAASPLSTPGLTRFNAPGLTLGDVATFPNPAANISPETKRRCRPCKKERKNRRVCWKGLYKETRTSEKFTRWQRIDCRTGKELSNDNVIQFPQR